MDLHYEIRCTLRSVKFRCCNLKVGFHSWPRDTPQSPGLDNWNPNLERTHNYHTGYCARVSILFDAFPLSIYELFLRGSYTSPVTHKRCKRTASLRATPTITRFFAAFPPPWHLINPHRLRSESCPKGPRICCAEPVKRRLTKLLPALVMGN
jgi:hypothetical protein